MQQIDKRWFRLLISIFSFFIVCLILLARWNVSLVEEVKKSGIEKEDLKKYIEKIEVLDIRQKAISLCFRELIGEYGEKYTSKEIQDCIQLIVMTDKQYGNKGLDAPLILSWLEKESKGNPEAVSQAGAKGLTQWMDYKAWKILIAMGYPGYDKELVFNPVVSLAGGLYYLNGLMNFWEWKGLKVRDLVLFYTLCSYRYESEDTEELYNTNRKENGPLSRYADWILERREYWIEKLKYWINDAHELAERWEGKKDAVIDY